MYAIKALNFSRDYYFAGLFDGFVSIPSRAQLFNNLERAFEVRAYLILACGDSIDLTIEEVSHAV